MLSPEEHRQLLAAEVLDDHDGSSNILTYFDIRLDNVTESKRHRTEKSVFKISKKPTTNADVMDLLLQENGVKWMQDILDFLNTEYFNLEADDFIGVEIISDSCSADSCYPIYLSIRKWKDFSAELIIQQAEATAQSNRVFDLNLPFTLTITAIKNNKKE